ncbi:MAG: hypothetical protein P1V20_27570 [Verrucomicrobiales bacterium]|nr:hypothetical protein [Verrucomicrobiales bacterium]
MLGSPASGEELRTAKKNPEKTSVYVPPLWNENLRLVGVSSMNRKQTAYFADRNGTVFLPLDVGESLPEGLKLLRIENFTDPQNCKAVFSCEEGLIVVGTSSSAKSTQEKTDSVETGQGLEAGKDRPTIQKWTGGGSW